MKHLKIAPAKPLNPLDRGQRQFLEGALRSFERGCSRYHESDTKGAPKRIRNAERLVNRYLRKINKANDRINVRVEKRAHTIRQEILFGDLKKALAMIEKAEKEFAK